MRIPKVPKETVIEELKKNVEKIQESVNLPSAQIWQDVSRSFGNQMTSKALYTFVRKNSGNCWMHLELEPKHFKWKLNPGTTRESGSDESEQDDISFTLSLATSQWITIRPINSSKKHLEKGWTDVINSLLLDFDETDECIWVFKKSYVTDTYFSLQAQCKECRANLCGISYLPQTTDEAVLVNCTLSPVDKKKHTGEFKRKLTGKRRKELGDLLSGKLAINVLREKSYESKRHDTKLRETPSLLALRKCKSENTTKNKCSEISGIKSPITRLEVLKWTVPYIHSIHQISADKFFLHYWTPEQQSVYSSYCKNKKNFPTLLAIDATGGLVEKLQRPYNNKSQYIFLYTGVIHLSCKHGQIPVVQMLSEMQDTNTISYWLKSWCRSTASLPNITVTDHSLALLGAVCWAFNEMYLNTYIDTAIRILDGEHLALPKVFIRVDYAHLIKLITRWKCFNGKPRRLKEFYLHCMSKLIKCSCTEEADQIIEALLVVSQSEFVGYAVDGKPLPSENCRNYLKKLIAGLEPINIETEDTENSLTDETSEELPDYVKPENAVRIWIRNFKTTTHSKINHQSDVDNFHYCPSFSNELLRFLVTYVLWSAIMNPHFGYGRPSESSAIIESYFMDLKSRTFKTKQLPTSVDNFFVHHYDAIQSMITVANSELQKKDILDSKIQRTKVGKEECPQEKAANENSVPFSADIDNINATTITYSAVEDLWEEGWRNLNNKASNKRKRRAYYGIPCPEILFVDDNKKIKLPVIQNGSILKFLSFEGNRYNLTNTCAFDSVIQCMLSAICDSAQVRDYLLVPKRENKVLDLIMNVLEHGVNKNTYSMRLGAILHDISTFQNKTLLNGIISIDCSCNISYIIRKFFVDFPSIIENPGGPKEKMLPLIFLKHDLAQKMPLKELEHLLDISDSLIDISPLIFIEVDYGSCRLSDLPITIKVLEKHFLLRGVCNFIKPAAPNGLGHYNAYCRRNDSRWEVFDDMKKNVAVADTTSTVLPHILFYSI